MRLDIPFTYEVVHRLPRRRNESTAEVAGTVSVEIREVDRSELTTIMRYRHTTAKPRSLAFMMSCPLAEFVEFDGGTFRTAFRGYDRDEGPMEPSDLLVDASDQRTRERLADLSLLHPRETYGDVFESVEAVGAKEILKDGRVEAEERIREDARGVVVCDGTVYVRWPEPLLQIVSVFDPEDERRRRPIAVALHPSFMPVDGEEVAHPRADRGPEEAEARTPPEPMPGRFDRDMFLAAAPEVLRPDLLRYDDRAVFFRVVAKRIEAALAPLAGVSQAASSAYRRFEAGVACMTEDAVSVERAAPALVAAARSVRDLLVERHSFLPVDRFLEVGENHLLPRLRDAEAVAGLGGPFGIPRASAVVFVVPVGEGADVADLSVRLAAAGTLSARPVEGGIEVSVPCSDWENAERVLQSALDAVREDVRPAETFAF